MVDTATTPRMRRQLRLLAVLAGFALLIVAVAFLGAFRDTSTKGVSRTLVALPVAVLRNGASTTVRVPADVLVDGKRYSRVELLVAREGSGALHAFWSRSTHLGCRVVRVADATGELRASVVPGAAFVDPCGGSTWAIDGVCIGGPCPRGLDGFRIVERDGNVYADLTAFVHGAPR
jgi:hypothetical protein